MTQMRTVVVVRDNLIARIDKYVDAPMVETFMRLFNADQQPSEA